MVQPPNIRLKFRSETVVLFTNIYNTVILSVMYKDKFKYLNQYNHGSLLLACVSLAAHMM